MIGQTIGSYGYRLWAPRKLLPKDATPSLDLLAHLPMALSAGGTFRQRLCEILSARGIEPNVGVETTSFAQALEALRSGAFAAILPEFATTHLDEKRFAVADLPELKQAKRTLLLTRRKPREDLAGAEQAILGALKR